METEQPATSRVAKTFTTLDQLAEAISAARTLGLADITVTTVLLPRHGQHRGDEAFIPRRVEYHLDAAKFDPTSDDRARNLAHVAQARAELHELRADPEKLLLREGLRQVAEGDYPAEAGSGETWAREVLDRPESVHWLAKLEASDS